MRGLADCATNGYAYLEYCGDLTAIFFVCLSNFLERERGGLEYLNNERGKDRGKEIKRNSLFRYSIDSLIPHPYMRIRLTCLPDCAAARPQYALAQLQYTVKMDSGRGYADSGRAGSSRPTTSRGRDAMDDDDERIGRYHRGRPHSHRNEEFDSSRRGHKTRGGGGTSSDGEYGRNYRRPRHCTSDGDDHYHRYRDHGIASSTGTSSAGGDKRPSKRPKQKRIWPPPFDTDGALYVFDSRSGFFYEAESNFYYDPKSRYYYSIDAAAYFQHCPELEPPFRKVSPQQEEETKKEDQKKREMDKHTISGAEQASLPATKSNNEGGEGGSGKMKIAISLKTKTPLGAGATASSLKSSMDTRIVENSSMLGREKQSSPTTESCGIKQIQAQAYDADIAKWNNARSSNRTTSTSSIPADNKDAPKTTLTGQPICLLCRRKFANTAALQKHEQSSALHKQNLAKKKRDRTNSGDLKPTGAESSGKSSIEYRDRAKDRRSMYGIELSHGGEAVISSTSALAVDIGPSLEKARPVVSAEVVRPSDALGDSNIGSQMLKKLGWKQGSSLGREQSPEAGGNSDGGQGGGSVANAQMVKEWETIESAAAAAPSSQTAARGVTNNKNSRAGIGAGRYKSG